MARTDALIDEFAAGRASRASVEAAEIRTLASAAAIVVAQHDRERLKTDIPARSMVAALAVETRLSERTVQRLMGEAADLCDRFAPAVAALESGRISRAHVTVIHDVGYPIEDGDARSRYLEETLARAEETTPGRLRPIAEVIAARLNPESIDARHASACTRRAVRVIDLPDGMASLTAVMSATHAHGIHDRLTEQAHNVIRARDPRPDEGVGATASGSTATFGLVTDGDAFGGSHGPHATAAQTSDVRGIDEIRVDILTDLLLAGTPSACIGGDGLGAIRGSVQISIPVLTLAGSGTEPAILVGHGPIDSATARRLAGAASGWDRVMTSPVTGAVLAVDRYRPSEDLKRFLRARDEVCRFPGCRMAARRCDLDHTHDHAAGGATEVHNLAHLCRGHHTLKHASPWSVRQSRDGTLHWTGPTGRRYADRPPAAVRFIPSDVSAPALDHPDDPPPW